VYSTNSAVAEYLSEPKEHMILIAVDVAKKTTQANQQYRARFTAESIARTH